MLNKYLVLRFQIQSLSVFPFIKVLEFKSSKEIDFTFSKKITKGCYLLDPRWGGLSLIICQKSCFLLYRESNPSANNNNLLLLLLLLKLYGMCLNLEPLVREILQMKIYIFE